MAEHQKLGRILIIDDCSDIRALIKLKLGEIFPEAIFSDASSGNEAIELIKQNKFDLVICDYLMPDGSGLDVHFFIRRLMRTVRQFQPPHFIMFTADKNMPSSPVWSRDFVIIPKTDIDELITTVQMLDFSREIGTAVNVDGSISDALNEVILRLADLLKREREMKEFSVAFVAEYLGIPDSKVQGWEDGTLLPPGSIIHDLARLYGDDASIRILNFVNSIQLFSGIESK